MVAKLKQQRADSQKFKEENPDSEKRPVGRPPKESKEQETEEMAKEYNQSDEMPEQEQKPIVTPPEKPIEVPRQEKMTREQQIAMEIELLQNNGRYRAELLHQLQEMNKSLKVIAGVLAELSGEDGQEGV